MPLNSIPPTTTTAGLECKREEARKIGVKTDLGFWGGIIPGNQEELVPMLDAGVKGFKCFLIESGVDVSFSMTTTLYKSSAKSGVMFAGIPLCAGKRSRTGV